MRNDFNVKPSVQCEKHAFYSCSFHFSQFWDTWAFSSDAFTRQ